MTESRQFGVTANDENFLIITDNGRELSQLQVCALLNDFNDENKELREYNKEMVKDIKDLEYENEQLKKEVKELQGKASSWKITASEEMMKQSELMKENEQLKKVIDEADDLIKSHLTNHYKTKWKNICEYYGVDIE